MKIKQPKSFVPAISTAVGVIIGAMVGRVGYSFTGLDTKDTQTQSMAKGTLALVGLGGSAFIDGDDNVASLTRGALLGLGAEQALSVVALNAKGKVENKTAKAALGLSCPCNGADGFTGRALGQGRVIPLLPGYQSDYLQEPTNSTRETNSISVIGL